MPNRIAIFRRLSLAATCLCLALSARTPLAAQDKSPTDVFLAYRAALVAATSYTDILPFMEEKSRTLVEAMPEKQRDGMFGFLKKFSTTFTEIAVTKETVTGDTAVLALSGKDPKGQPATGSVPMTKEASGWKVGTEKWSSAPRGGGQ